MEQILDIGRYNATRSKVRSWQFFKVVAYAGIQIDLEEGISVFALPGVSSVDSSFKGDCLESYLNPARDPDSHWFHGFNQCV